MARQKKQKEKKPKQPLRNRAFWALVYLTLTLLLVIGVTLIVRQHVLIPGEYTPPDLLSLSAPTPTPTLPPDATPAPTPVPTPYVKVAPVRIYFDAHQLQADIEPVGLLDDTSIDTVPSATVAGWFDLGAPPGDPGNSIISGHVSWRGKKGTFSVLHDMVIGEQVTIEFENGAFRVFEVVSTNTYKVEDFPAFVTDFDGDTRLTLITCLGDYDRSQGMSLSRVVVECVEKRELRVEAPAQAEPSQDDPQEGAAGEPTAASA